MDTGSGRIDGKRAQFEHIGRKHTICGKGRQEFRAGKKEHFQGVFLAARQSAMANGR
jgi:hypothetical protein